jgi:hypothetical protein
MDIYNLKYCTFDMKAKVLAIPIIATVTLIAMIGIMSYSAQEVNAQNMTKMEDRGDFGNILRVCTRRC